MANNKNETKYKIAPLKFLFLKKNNDFVAPAKGNKNAGGGRCGEGGGGAGRTSMRVAIYMAAPGQAFSFTMRCVVCSN
jgi:hypothetical protein